VLITWLVVAGETVMAFLALDVVFRLLPVEAGNLRSAVRRYGYAYAGVAFLLGAVGALAQWRSAQYHGLALAPLDVLPWWVLWRFGLRKQLPPLFPPGTPRAKKPTP